jgi:tetratricopeptide (TPR) repeat protein
LRPELGVALANALVKAGRVAEGLALCKRLIEERQDNPNPWLHFVHGSVLCEQARYKDAEAAWREVIRLKHDYAEAHNDLGVALGRQRRYKEAEAAFREFLRLKPDLFEAHYNLGVALIELGKFKQQEAEELFHEAIRLKPDSAEAHYSLGTVLGAQGRHPDAEAACRRALRLKPDCPEAHYGLGVALNNQGRPREAEAAWREAIRLKPDYPEAQYSLGAVLSGQGRYPEAEAAYRQAVRLKHDYPEAHTNLGNALYRQGKYREAEPVLRDAIRLNPDDPLAHGNLGVALAQQGKFREAEAAFRRALDLKYDPVRQFNLALALKSQGRFADALQAYREGHKLGSTRPGWSYPSGKWIAECQRLVELDRKLPAVVKGEVKPASVAEGLELALLCRHPARRLHATMVRLAAAAFADNPKLAGDLDQQHRYGAACSAALAAAGLAEDAKGLPEKDRAALRQQALNWLRADLAVYAMVAQRDDPRAKAAVQERLVHWQRDPDFTAVREPAALAKLPESERAAWRQLWANVAALQKKVAPVPATK